jgi:hypothetical protein
MTPPFSRAGAGGISPPNDTGLFNEKLRRLFWLLTEKGCGAWQKMEW